jgi:micrococcal nuclease
MSLRPPTLPSSPSWRRPYSAAPATLLVVASVIFGLWGPTSHAASLTPDDAANHVGQSAKVCGVVALTNFDFGKPYPDQVFTAVIYGADRVKFEIPKAMLRGKRVCVEGSIREYRGKPEIVLTDPSQLTQ